MSTSSLWSALAAWRTASQLKEMLKHSAMTVGMSVYVQLHLCIFTCVCAHRWTFDTLLVETCLTACCEKVRADACRGRGHLFVYMISFMCAIRYICLCVYISILLSVYLSRYHVYTYTCMCRYVHMYVLSFVRMYACK